MATDGLGAGPQPESRILAVDIPDDATPMARLRLAIGRIADPPASIVEAVEGFDPDHTAVVFGTFLTESPALVGRQLVAHRRPEWVALEDKTTVDALLDRAGVARAPSVTADLGDAVKCGGASTPGRERCGRSMPATASTAGAPARAG